MNLAGCSILVPTPIPDPVDLLCTWEQEEYGTTLTFEIDGKLEYSGLLRVQQTPPFLLTRRRLPVG